MTFLSQSAGRRAGTPRRSRAKLLRDIIATTAFILAVGFTAALVFGFLGH